MSTPPRRMLASARWCAPVAAGAAVVLALTSWRIAAVPNGWRPAGVGPYIGYYAALAALIMSWLMLGRRVLGAGDSVSVASLRHYLLCAATPLLAAAPFGRDLWAYAAQGNLVAHHIDPYTHGPAALPGPFAAQVSPRWVTSPSPYGSLWLQICRGIDALAGGHSTIGVLLLRLPAFAALLLGMWAVPVIARRFGRAPEPALWLGLASPLMLVLGVGGGHNDVVMIGLVLVGLALATRPRLVSLALGAGVLGAAVLIKSPAALALGFAVPIWLHANRLPMSPRRLAAACATAAAAAAAVFAAITAACGLGMGWLGQVNPDAPWVSWLSLPTAAAMLAKVATGQLHQLGVLDEAVRRARAAGEVLLAAGSALLWLRSLRRAPLTCLAAALGMAALLAPAVQPWYYCWGLALAGLAVPARVVIPLAAIPVMFTVMITPSGVGLEGKPAAFAIVFSSFAAVVLILRGAVPDEPTDPAATHRSVGAATDPRTPNAERRWC